MTQPSIDPLLLGQDALRLLSLRMEAAPETIPSGALLRYMEVLAKLELARLQAQPPEDDKPDLTITEILDIDGLPAERKHQLLLEARARAQAEIDSIDQLLGELDASQVGSAA